jgi:hypothetical protein
MSLLGIGSARLSASVAEYHALLMFMSAALLSVSLVVNVRRDAGGFNKAPTVTASAIAFIVASGWFGRSDRQGHQREDQLQGGSAEALRVNGPGTVKLYLTP